MADDSIRSARPIDLEGLVNPGLRQKVIYAGSEPVGQPYFIVTADGIAMVGDESNVISLNPDYGVNLSGRIALSCMPAQISIGGGYWRFNPLALSCIPSTSATPVPFLNKAKPQWGGAGAHIGLLPSGAGLPPSRSAAAGPPKTPDQASQQAFL